MHIYQSPSRQTAVQLLSAAGLPTTDLPSGRLEHFWGCGNPDKPNGIVGLEIHGPYGLLRSLVVDEAYRNRGCAKALVSALERYARLEGLSCMYLLTETAEQFFSSLGYEVVARSEVPDPIRATREFSGLCPHDAAVMKKPL